MSEAKIVNPQTEVVFWGKQQPETTSLSKGLVEAAYQIVMMSEANQFLSDDQCRKLFISSLKGASDLTIDLLKTLLQEYSIDEAGPYVDIVSNLVSKLHELMVGDKNRRHTVSYNIHIFTHPEPKKEVITLHQLTDIMTERVSTMLDHGASEVEVHKALASEFKIYEVKDISMPISLALFWDMTETLITEWRLQNDN